MAESLPYFKFNPQAWLSGDIILEDKDTQADFILICCYYWMRCCNVKIAKLHKKYGLVIAKLLDSNIISDNQGVAKISFLDEQWADLSENHQQRVRGGKLTAEKRWGKKSIDNQQFNSSPNSSGVAEQLVSRIDKNIIQQQQTEFSKNEKPQIGDIRDYYFQKGRESDFSELAEKFTEFNEKIGWRGLAKQTWQELAEAFLNYEPAESVKSQRDKDNEKLMLKPGDYDRLFTE